VGGGGFVFLPALYVSVVVLLSKELPVVTIPGGVVGIIWSTLGLIWIALVIPYPFKRKDVYLYEQGFLCLRGHRVQVARWEQISSVEKVRYKGGALVALKVHLNDTTRIMLPNTVDHFGEPRSYPTLVMEELVALISLKVRACSSGENISSIP
jgi:hypothetical protein